MVLYLQSCFLKAELCISALNGRTWGVVWNVPELQSVLLGGPPSLWEHAATPGCAWCWRRRSAEKGGKGSLQVAQDAWKNTSTGWEAQVLPSVTAATWGMRDTPALRSRRCALCPGRCLSCAVVWVLQNKVILQVSFHLLVWNNKQHLLHSFCVSVLEFKILDHLWHDNTRKHQPVIIAAFCLFCQESNVQEAGATAAAVQRWWSCSWQSWRFLRRKELQASQMPLGKAGKAPLPFRSRQFYSHFSNNSHVRFLLILVSLRKDKLPSSTICSGAGSIILLCSLYCIFLEQIN